MPPLNVRDLGDFIRDQRKAAHISVRQLARQAGVSNPYLSQIERGLRKPSAEILQQIAKALRISAEVLYVQAGILDERASDSDVTAAVLADSTLTERQKQVIAEIYDAFRKENAVYGLTGRPALPDSLRRGISTATPAAALTGSASTASTAASTGPTTSTGPAGSAPVAETSVAEGTAAETKPAGTTRRATGATRAAATPAPRAPGTSDTAPK
ncbi:helix-turn-helix domain-containing protein, partial [Frankia sp. CiP1_Cm_nod1]|uniref:helix-turn-helix domain-containing protein n=1 Tax=Frankia sp. CiP1_Cm_nod1 TaxID=2897160 RepID=UPI00404395D5